MVYAEANELGIKNMDIKDNCFSGEDQPPSARRYSNINFSFLKSKLNQRVGL